MPTDHMVRREFYIWEEAITRWKGEGLPDDYNECNLFGFDPPAAAAVGLDLGWCEPPFYPYYEDKVVKSEGDTEVIQDFAGRWMRVFVGKRHGFMPEYMRHPVTCRKDWEEDVGPRLVPTEPARYARLDEQCAEAARLRDTEQRMVFQGMVGGYMYLRALIGPVDLLYRFVDDPELIHDIMRQWTAVMDAGLTRIQARIELDELMMAEDICYNHGLLISPNMVKEFLLPYYQQVVGNARARQKRKLYYHVDTDGWAEPAVPLYTSVGADAMSPWEVASGCDVVEIGRKYPNLIMAGGIDKRVLAEGKDAIDAHLARIMPAMLARGGYIPTCDHGVPDDVSFENYMYYRKRVCELDHE